MEVAIEMIHDLLTVFNTRNCDESNAMTPLPVWTAPNQNFDMGNFKLFFKKLPDVMLGGLHGLGSSQIYNCIVIHGLILTCRSVWIAFPSHWSGCWEYMFCAGFHASTNPELAKKNISITWKCKTTPGNAYETSEVRPVNTHLKWSTVIHSSKPFTSSLM